MKKLQQIKYNKKQYKLNRYEHNITQGKKERMNL